MQKPRGPRGPRGVGCVALAALVGHGQNMIDTRLDACFWNGTQ
jgi:hypothetical protein